ncbi:MAG TPA: ligase-associated DNA damage response endonuclease PdeM [Planctomycetaceae bacterium]|nr:ligase-associated DNA damage response endonuclease PdeM [Planctomycetaceae bacterium]
MRIEFNGVNADLLPEKALWLPGCRVLVVADTHFGKDASFRKSGLAVPRGSSEETLSQIDSLVSRYRPNSLVFLGDMFHAKCSLTAELNDGLRDFFRRHSGVSMHLTLGNHDVAADRFPVEWPLEVSRSLCVEDTTFEHFPRELGDGERLVCGHLHPAVKIDDVGRLPCFWLSGSQLVLPAIGEFTGAKTIVPSPEDRVWITDGSNVHEFAYSR